MSTDIAALREKANMLPLLPGVYIMKDDGGEVIYVGKAKALKNRVTSYFRGDHAPKVAAMVSHVADFEVIVASSEFEALVLENSLIKRHRPYYNILLKDDKGYPFIRLDMREEYPRMTIQSRAAGDGARYFGPFGGRGVTWDIIDTICHAMKLPSCSRRFPRDLDRDRPCLNKHMGLCSGWCSSELSSADYRAIMGEVAMMLDGRTDTLTQTLTDRMLAASEAMNFEQAAELRDRIRAVEGLKNHQRVIFTSLAETDAVGFFRGARCCFAVLHYRDGELEDKDFSLLDEPLEDDSEAVSELVRQYYTGRGAYPKVILLPVDIDDGEGLARLFSEEAGRRVYVETPKRGERVRFTEAAVVNAREEVQRATTERERRVKTLEWLAKALGLPGAPERIEAFDISNTGDFGIVAAMTVFVNGRPLKRDYRKFRIKTTDGQNDYGSMREAVTRRFRRLLDGDEKFSAMPDLLLIDGGAEHAAVARGALEELGLAVPIYGMVKDARHRTRALVSPEGREVAITASPAVFSLIGNIQEETHNAAITYHRKLRDEAAGSELDAIKGVGAKRRSELLKHFKSVKAVRAASREELERAVPKNTARAVWEHYHGGGEQSEDE